jgi:hypothetical protein
VQTGDFTRDERAALATSDVISRLLTAELGTMPLGSSGGGFTYRLDPALGTSTRATSSFGPRFTERALTLGRFRRSLDISHRAATFHELDNRDLRDGTLVATAAHLRSESEPFDVETITLRLHTDTVTVSGTFGLTDRLDVGAVLPLLRLSLSGQRVDTYRGQRIVQATASGTASGLGDVVGRAKFLIAGERGTGFAVGVESTLPTGSEENLLGSGRTTVRPFLVASFEGERIGGHGNVGYVWGGLSKEANVSGAVTVIATSRLTGFGELGIRRLESIGRLVQVTEAHPTLAGVDTIRLTTRDAATTRLTTAFGMKWNPASSWLIGAAVLRPLSTAGLNARWMPMLTFDYSFGE